MEVDEIFYRSDSSGTSGVLSDALGSTLALADSSGSVETSYTYDPFGNPSSTGTSSSNTQQYTGRENDGTGLQHNRARYYSPTLQRFISEDPLGFGGCDANLYAYARNDPINATDPSGEIISAVIVGGAYLVGGVIGGVAGWKLAGRKDRWSGAVQGAVYGCAAGTVATAVAIVAVAAVVEATAEAAIIGLTPEAARLATTEGTGIQHGYNHVADALELGNWNAASRDAARSIAEDAMTAPSAVVWDWTMKQGQQMVDICIGETSGEPYAVFVNKAGRVVTTVIASVEQLENWGVGK